MNGKPFFDTNLLIYAVAESDSRAEIARDLLAGGGVVSIQVLNEFAAVARRKIGMSWQEIGEVLRAFQSLCPEPVPITLKTHEAALGIAEQYGYRIYDSLVIAAALEVPCDILYSEDMQSGQKIEGLTIRNPF
jgi:predicted nucleic acid-binding protein